MAYYSVYHTRCDVTSCFQAWATGDPHNSYLGIVHVWVWVAAVHAPGLRIQITGDEVRESVLFIHTPGSRNFKSV